MTFALKAQSGSYFYCLLLDDEVLRVKVVSSTFAGILFVVIFAIFLIVIGIGGVVGGLLAGLIGLLIIRQIGNSRQKKLSALSLDELKKEKGS